MGKTNIEYGERTWNWYPGCNGPNGMPCPYCWARNRVLPRMKCLRCKSLEPHLHSERMNEPYHVKKPTRFLVCFTGDWMNAPENFIREALKIMQDNPRHTFLTLTKQPQNLVKYSPFPANCWLGVSATNREEFSRSCSWLGEIKAAIKYISLEPLLSWEGTPAWGLAAAMMCQNGIRWLIIGAQTRPTVLPNVEWVQGIVHAADQAGVKVWLKNSLLPLVSQTYGRYPPSWAFKNGELRKEIPR